ncbi:MAG: FAD-dependent oxidoreductase [Desulfohalobiaceae bacterium]|nr:FAD-dependent oxidoreductase [Desulfohalobiaceae bacterium]
MSQNILVIGGGFGGITAALEAAEVGHEVYLVEKAPYLGGRVMQLNKYFPKLCPPSCGLEIQFQRIKKNPKIHCLTLAEVVSVSGSAGNYEVAVRVKPRYTAPYSADLRELAAGLSKDVENEFEFGLSTRKALYMDVPFAFPQRYTLDMDNLEETDRKKLSKKEFINLEDKEKTITLNCGSIILATGWKPYDATNLTLLGAGNLVNCITNMQMERLAAPNGPTNGRIQRPSDGRPPKKCAFVQCAGSRDENHLEYCSYICCMASLKQTQYLREQYPETEVTIFYIDLRTPGRYEKFAQRILADEKVRTVKGKVAAVEEDLSSKGVWVTAEDAVSGNKLQECFDLVVLATGMQPSLSGEVLPMDVTMDENGFVASDPERGIFAVGCAKEPLDVMKSAQSGTSAAMQAIQTVRGR